MERLLSSGVAEGLYLADAEAKSWDYAEQAAAEDDAEMAMLVLEATHLPGLEEDLGVAGEEGFDLGQYLYSGKIPTEAVVRVYYIDEDTDKERPLRARGLKAKLLR